MTPTDLPQLFRSAVALLPEGGQRTARRNAWAAMSEDSRRARDRREAAAAFGVPAGDGAFRRAGRSGDSSL